MKKEANPASLRSAAPSKGRGEGASVDAPSFLWGRMRYENTAISFLPLFLDLSILFSCRLRS